MHNPELSMKECELPFVREMFDRIASRYDFLNRLLSLRRDVFWRHTLVKALRLPQQGWILDVACGTGDIALEITRQKGPQVHVTGVDFAARMLQLAQSKIKTAQACQQIDLIAGDALSLPFENHIFDAVTIAFGIRNIQHKLKALQQFYHQLKPGGQLAILELALPDSSLLRWIYLFYFNRLLPLLGRFFSKHGFAYTYLPLSVAGFPTATAFAALMRQAGFKQVRYRKLTMGVAVVFIGSKP
jgi:demethylmenaquinone methyltransferase/2-methoxy-6-polyprenyl-1,4-benzoquinol methylase